MKYCAALALMLIAACAMGGAQKAAAPAETRPQTMPSGTESPKDELDRLYAQVEQERAQMQLAEPMVTGMPDALPMSQPTTQTDAACRPAQSETCTSSCKLSDSICTNAGRICKLADELAPDADAAAKCVKADKTCKTAHDKCCGCQL